MNSLFRRLMICSLLFALLALSPGVLAQAGDLLALRQQARAAYDQGRCDQVLSIYNRVGMQDGTLIEGVDNYRIGFCLAYLRRGDATSYYEAAASTLAAETDVTTAPLEAYFYQVNALLNLRRESEAVTAANLAVERWEAGELVIPESDAESWFRLGKLFRDAGDIYGAVKPFGRALDAAEAGGSLRDPYLERIARGAAEAGNKDLASRASVLLAKASQGDTASSLRVAKALLAAGETEKARESFASAAKAAGEAGLAGQYALRVLDRIDELQAQGVGLLDALPSGQPLSELRPTDFERELTSAARAAWQAMQGRMVEVPRKKKAGTRARPHPDTAREILKSQQLFVSLAHTALMRSYPLREWAIGGGYTPLIYHRWTKVYHQRAREQRRSQVIEVIED